MKAGSFFLQGSSVPCFHASTGSYKSCSDIQAACCGKDCNVTPERKISGRGEAQKSSNLENKGRVGNFLSAKTEPKEGGYSYISDCFRDKFMILSKKLSLCKNLNLTTPGDSSYNFAFLPIERRK